MLYNFISFYTISYIIYNIIEFKTLLLKMLKWSFVWAGRRPLPTVTAGVCQRV
jgi:hypothetical protein